MSENVAKTEPVHLGMWQKLDGDCYDQRHDVKRQAHTDLTLRSANTMVVINFDD